VVLGIMQEHQPCTAYRIRVVLRESPSSFWSGSAGAIYPLLKRLEATGLIEASVDAEDRRGRRLLRLTSAGRRRHLDWMLSASSLEVAGAVSDPVRSRAFSLSALGPGDRRRFVNDSLQALEAFLDVARTDLERRQASGDPYSSLAALGAVYQAEARVKWMGELRDHLSQEQSSGIGPDSR
jgi:DNA-binding PadR family transcriptional regulator